jgi:hypothetical protein
MKAGEYGKGSQKIKTFFCLHSPAIKSVSATALKNQGIKRRQQRAHFQRRSWGVLAGWA